MYCALVYLNARLQKIHYQFVFKYLIAKFVCGALYIWVHIF